jgi:RimJ/RimL family protein N-acetyltransferase
MNVGFVLFPKYWGYGYATEALMAVKTTFISNGIVSMRATVATPNAASSRVLIKCGFTRGNLVTDEVDTHEWNFTISRARNEKAQQGDAPEPAST